jgi:hypothetical protein
MNLDKITVNIPGEGRFGGPWIIAFPWKKLQLKYGLYGPWKKVSWSGLFDDYAATRGPKAGLPIITDFAVTLLMNSTVRKKDLETLSTWREKKRNIQKLIRLRELVLTVPNMHAANRDVLVSIGKTCNSILQERDKRGNKILHGIGIAKLFKWLSVWAPEHIPMIDSIVYYAVTKQSPKEPYQCEKALCNYQYLLGGKNYKYLLLLGEKLGHAVLSSKKPISPVRILENLIWFDYACRWYPYYKNQFRDYIDFSTWRKHYYSIK